MPIWGRGVCKHSQVLGRWPGHGFTLVELLITLVVLAVAAAVLVVNSRSSSAQQLHSEAQRLAALLRIAQQEALLQGGPVRLVWTAQGYAFEQSPADPALPPGALAQLAWKPAQEPLLRPRAWPVEGMQGVVGRDGIAQQALVLGAGQGALGVRVVLSLPPHQVQVLGLPGQGFVVQTALTSSGKSLSTGGPP